MQNEKRIAPTQLVFDLPHRLALGREDFLVAASNAQAVDLIDSWPDWASPVQALVGDAGCGKSHLAAVWSLKTSARTILASDLRDDELPDYMDAPALVIDDVQEIAPAQEEVLFHLYNHAQQSGKQQNGKFLLLCAAVELAKLPIQLNDLRSRLAACAMVRLSAPDDALMSAVLVKLFADRQLHISEKIIAYMIPRIERSFASLNEIVARLDKAALTDQRAITIPLVNSILLQGD